MTVSQSGTLSYERRPAGPISPLLKIMLVTGAAHGALVLLTRGPVLALFSWDLLAHLVTGNVVEAVAIALLIGQMIAGVGLVVGCLGSLRGSFAMWITLITSCFILLTCEGIEIVVTSYNLLQHQMFWVGFDAARRLFACVVPTMLLVTMLRRDVRELFNWRARSGR